MTQAVIALGSNLGARAGNLQAAIDLMPEFGVRPVRISGAWETLPVPADQPPFLNAVLVAETDLTADALLAALKRIEHALGRRPGVRWGPRPIDLDILFFGEAPRDTPELTIPHPFAATRAFVLAPLAEVTPGPLPVLGETALALLGRTDASGLRRTGVVLTIRELEGFSNG